MAVAHRDLLVRRGTRFRRDRPGHDDAAHERPLGEEEDDDRHGHRHERGRLDQRRLASRTARCTAGSRSTAAGVGLAAEVQQRQEEVVPGEEEVEQADRHDGRRPTAAR